MLSRRSFEDLVGAAACEPGVCPRDRPQRIPLAEHEAAMRVAIAAGKTNPFYPSGAVIIGAADRTVRAAGVNNSKANPILHGEIVAIDNYVAKEANQGRSEVILYTPGEPCPICMSAIVWAGIGGVVYGSSISTVAQAGIAQIMIDATALRHAAPFYRGQIIAGVLRAETDMLFSNRRRALGSLTLKLLRQMISK